MPTINDLFVDAYTEIRVARAGDVLAPELADRALLVFNRILDAMNADGRTVWADDISDVVLTPSLSPHTIGPGGTFNVTLRPVRLEYAALNLGGNPAVYQEINVRSEAWYQRQGLPGMTQTFPTDVWYQPAWPLGKLYFWGIPTVAYTVRLWLRTVLTAITDPTIAVSFPPGYQDLLTLTLADWLAPGQGQTLSASTAQRLLEARARVVANNEPEFTLATDSGLPASGSGSGESFNWRSRSFT